MNREIGTTGIKVYPIGFGCMPLSVNGRPDENKSFSVIEKAIDLGINFFDTADVYCLSDEDIGHNERLISKCLKQIGVKNEVIIATKGGLTRPEGRWERDASPESITKACERSLKNLGLDVITLYQLHAPDPKVPFELTIETLAVLQQSGKIKHIGLSNVSLEQLDIAQKIVKIASVQNCCNPFYKKDFSSGLVQKCNDDKVSYLPYSTVGGHLGHKSAVENTVIINIAKKYEVSTYQVILAWHLSKGNHILPIPGASKISSITNSAGSVDLTLSEEDISLIDSI